MRPLHLLALGLIWQIANLSHAEDWPQWRGPGGLAVSTEKQVPTRWTKTENIRWSALIPGEGSSSPIVWGKRVFVTSSQKRGEQRLLHTLDRDTGELLRSREIADDNPEITSSVTGYAASTPATDGRHVVAFFGNAGVACYDFNGDILWQRRLGEFETELGLASSPVIDGDRVYLLCDHDGAPPTSFASFLTALDLKTGEPVWTTKRPGLFRSWSTPILVPTPEGKQELVVNAQDELRGYDPASGKLLWHVLGMTDWVTPSPIFGGGHIFATSGKDGPTLAVKPGGRGDVTQSHVVWREPRGGPYVCSPLLYDGRLYVHTDQGVLTCYEAATGKVVYRQRLGGKFTASGVAAADHLYLLNEAGECHVIKAGNSFESIAINRLEEPCYASPAIANGCLFLRTETRLYCIQWK